MGYQKYLTVDYWTEKDCAVRGSQSNNAQWYAAVQCKPFNWRKCSVYKLTFVVIFLNDNISLIHMSQNLLRFNRCIYMGKKSNLSDSEHGMDKSG